MDFKGKSVIITGASKGIGSETARMFAEKGARIVVNYFSSPTKAEKTLKALHGLGAEAFSFKADVSSSEEVSSMITDTIRRFGKIDVLVNNAAKHLPQCLILKSQIGNTGKE